MRYLPHVEVLEVTLDEAVVLVEKLRQKGYRYLRDGAGKRRSLWTPDGRMCVSEHWSGRVWFDGCVLTDLDLPKRAIRS